MQTRKVYLALVFLLSFALYVATVASGASQQPEEKTTKKVEEKNKQAPKGSAAPDTPQQPETAKKAEEKKKEEDKQAPGSNTVLQELLNRSAQTAQQPDPELKEATVQGGAAAQSKVPQETPTPQPQPQRPAAPPSPVPTPPSVKYSTTGAQPGSREQVKLNFDNLPFQDFVNQVAGMLGINYVIDPKLASAGAVNIFATKPIYKEDLFSIFEKILQLNGAAIVKDMKVKDLYYIVPLTGVRSESGIPIYPTTVSLMTSQQATTIRVKTGTQRKAILPPTSFL